MNTPFLVLGLPRSRTFWTSKFLAFNGRRVEHNQFVRYRTLNDIVHYFDHPNVGASDPAVGAIWRDLLPHLPDVRVAVIRRSPAEVLASLRKIGTEGEFMPRLLERYAAELDALVATGRARAFEFALLGTPSEAAALFEYCAEAPLDVFWWQVMGTRNLQSPEVSDPLAAKEACLDGPVARAIASFAGKEMEDAI